MKKIMISLLMVAATLNAMAITYTGKVQVVLRATSNNAACAAVFATSDALNDGLNPTYYAELNDEGKEVLAYVEYNNVRYEHFGSSAATMRNMPLVIKANASGQYRMEFYEMEGAIEIYDVVAGANIDKSGPYIFEIEDEQKNAVIADRFVINYDPTACVTVRENLEIGRYYTICLPQDIVSFNGGTFWSMSKRGVGVAYLEGEDAPLNAGQPYIFQATAEELCVVYGNEVPAATAGAAGALKGTFAAMGQAALSDAAADYNSPIYLLYHNELRPAAGAGNNLPANRAFIVYNLLDESEPNQAPGRRVRAIPMQTNGATGFENVDVEAAKAVKFMEDGKIFIKRGDAIYNLQGQLVK